MISGSMRREFYLTHYDPQRWVVDRSTLQSAAEIPPRRE